MIITMNQEKYDIAKKIRNYSDTAVAKDFENLKRLKCEPESQRSIAGLKIVDSATFAERLDTKGQKGGRSFYDVYAERERLITVPSYKRFFEREKAAAPSRTDEHIWHELARLYFSAATSFKPSVARYIYSKYGAKNILDFSAGWGGRLVAAMSLPDTTYIGIDTNTDLKSGYEKLIEKTKGAAHISRVNMLWQDSATVDYANLKYDFVFTSPPYFTIEKYTAMPEYKTLDDFNNNFWFPVLEKVFEGLDKNGTFALNIPEPMYLDTIKVLGQADFDIPLEKAKRFNKKDGEPNKYQGKTLYEERIYFWIK